ncbi:hypothetical protein ACJMK2_017239 [Sinanodonta woodiana]|uniref:Beta-1,4-galactosyltransferase n=1 Tax=Sinanodonta woodiana TaxID=1069815 RepID=A0ABD3UXK8_SINWO
MKLVRSFKCLDIIKRQSIAFFVIIGIYTLLYAGMQWSLSNGMGHLYINGRLTQLMGIRKDKFNNTHNIFLMDSNMDDLNHLVAGGKSSEHTANTEPCPETPPGLVGRLNISLPNIHKSVTNEDSLLRVGYGGRYRPSDCVAKERVGIIIPYRDRKEHLTILTRHLHNILQRQQLEYQIFVIEMALPTQFNRGLLVNVGVLFAKESGNFSCFIIHDVDALMMNDRNLYRCGSQPRHLVTGSTKYRSANKEYALPYDKYMSGVIALTDSQYKKANGFSNLYFGWGGEDDDFYIRVTNAKMTFKRPENDVGIYLAIPHENDLSNPINPSRVDILNKASARQSREGINSFYENGKKIGYKRYAIEYRQYYTWLLIGVNEAAIVKQFEE